MAAEITLDRVSFQYRAEDATPICEGVSLSIPPGQLVGIVGPSGVGKTTLLSLVAGLIEPSAGSIRIGNLSAVQAREAGRVAYAPQRGALCSWLTAQGNVELAIRLCGITNGSADKAEKLLLDLGLEKHRLKYPHELSGGMRQRVILAMALGVNRELVLLDEPFVSLDTYTRLSIHSFVLRQWENLDNRPTVLMISHDLTEAAYLCDSVVALTQRPFSELKLLEMPLDRPRNPPMRYQEEFLDAIKNLERLLEPNGHS